MYTLIIGGLSEIGKEFVRNRLKKDDYYILTETNENYDLLKETYESQINEGKILTFPLDVSDNNLIKDFFIKLNGKKIVISELVYLAGINQLVSAIDTTEEIWDRLMGINLKGCFFVMKEVAKIMIMNEISGSIVNIASQHGVVGNTERAAYCSSKAGLLNLNKVLALEWAKYGIRVNSVSPTFILYEKNYDYLMSNQSKRNYLRHIPLNNYCKANDIVNAISFLLSNENQMITGHNLIVDGGWTIK